MGVTYPGTCCPLVLGSGRKGTETDMNLILNLKQSWALLTYSPVSKKLIYIFTRKKYL